MPNQKTTDSPKKTKNFSNIWDFFSGLFSKAIAQSGTNLAAWAQPAHDGVAAKRATKLAQLLGCYKPKNWPKTLNCLRNESAENITAAFYHFFVSTCTT